MRDSFIFYRSFFEALNEIENDSKLSVYEAIAEYSLNQKEIELKGVSKAIFTLIKPQLNANLTKYENGRKGGRPKTETKPKNNLDETKPKANVNENENENDNVNDNVNVNVILSPFEKFWSIYPKKVEKAKTEKWFEKNKPDEDLLKTILGQVELWIKTKEWKDKQYIPYPTTWLNGKRWEDEVPQQKEEPKWFNQKIEQKTATEDERKEIENLLKIYE